MTTRIRRYVETDTGHRAPNHKSKCRHFHGHRYRFEAEIEGDIVECPLHFWHYNIKTGELMDYLKGIKLKKYDVDVRDDGIYVDA